MITLETEQRNINDVIFNTMSPYGVARKFHATVGRPIFDGRDESEVVAKLQHAFTIGSNTLEACGYADISRDSFYRYCKKYPEFRNRIELLQTTPILMARTTIYNAIVAKDLKTCWKFLERALPEEFSTKEVVRIQLEEKSRRIEYLENLLRSKKIRF